jgi:hypothetical protein
MSSADKSASGRTRRLAARTLAVYHRNSTLNDFGGSAKSSSPLTVLLREVGTNYGPGATCDTCCNTVCSFDNAFIFPFDIVDKGELDSQISELIGQPFTSAAPPGGYGLSYGLLLFFPPVCYATSYSVQMTLDSAPVSLTVNQYGAYDTPGFAFPQSFFYFIYPSTDVSSGDLVTNVVASNACSSSSTTAQFGCFLEGAPVTMADGSKKPIQDVVVGDSVMGAFGEANPVLALHRPLLGAGSVVRINNEHSTTSHHPHVSPDRQFYAVDPDRITSMTYGKMHTIILENGKKALRKMEGLAARRMKKLEVGITLQTSTGDRVVNTLDNVSMSPFTQVYHLVVGGSHTFIVEDYAVTGWPREDDFDYDTWTPRT